MNMLFDPKTKPAPMTEEVASPDTTPVPGNPPTLEDARAGVRSRPTITAKRRGDILTNLRKFETGCDILDGRRLAEAPPRARREGRPAANRSPILMTFEYAAPRLAAMSPAMLGCSQGRLDNVRSDVRGEIRNLGQLDPAAPLSPAWFDLRTRLSDEYHRVALTGGARFFSNEKIEPTAMSDEIFALYGAWRRTSTLAKNPAAAEHSFVRAWNHGCEHVDGWPGPKLTREKTRKTYTFRLEIFPQPVLADLDRFVARITEADDDAFFDVDDDPFRSDAAGRGGRSKPARPATVATRLYQARLALAALVHSGQDPESITSLAMLVEPLANARAILAFFRERAKRQPSSQNGGIAEFLRQIAKYHHPQPAATVAAITTWARKLGVKRGRGMTPKNRSRLRALTNARTRAMLLHLPWRLMALANHPDTKPAEAARLAMQAVIFEILLVCPLRLTNLTELELLRHLQSTDPRGRRITHIVIPEDETKNEEPICWPIPAESGALIQVFLDRHRAKLGDADGPYLFPGQETGGRTKGTIRQNIIRTAHRHLGVKINPHLLRAYAAWSYLKEVPNDYETVRRILGHRDIKTTIAYYVGLEAEFAALKFDSTVLRARRETRSIAMAAFRAARPKTPKGRK